MEIPFDELWTPEDAAEYLTGDGDLARHINAAILAGKLTAERREYKYTPPSRPRWEELYDAAIGYPLAKTEPKTVYEYEINPFHAVAWALSAGVEPLPECLSLYRKLTDSDQHEDDGEPRIAVAPAGKSPPALPTPAVAACFSGLHKWDYQQWLRNLGDPGKWMSPAIVARRTKPLSNLWDPVNLALALTQHDTTVTLKEVSRRFATRQELEPWRDAWQPYAEYFEDPSY